MFCKILLLLSYTFLRSEFAVIKNLPPESRIVFLQIIMAALKVPLTGRHFMLCRSLLRRSFSLQPESSSTFCINTFCSLSQMYRCMQTETNTSPAFINVRSCKPSLLKLSLSARHSKHCQSSTYKGPLLGAINCTRCNSSATLLTANS